MEQVAFLSFTTQFNGRARELITDSEVAPAFNAGDPIPAHTKFQALWDTGATNSAISQRVVDECGLSPISMAQVHGVHGPELAEVFLVCIRLPNGVGFRSVRVTKAKLTGADVLIGMDIIARGDFSVTNANGLTMLSFRFPSRIHTDFCAIDKVWSDRNTAQAHGGKKKDRKKKHKQFGKNK